MTLNSLFFHLAVSFAYSIITHTYTHCKALIIVKTYIFFSVEDICYSWTRMLSEIVKTDKDSDKPALYSTMDILRTCIDHTLSSTVKRIFLSSFLLFCPKCYLFDILMIVLFHSVIFNLE